MNELDHAYYFPKVLQAVPTGNYEVYAYFNDGSVRLVDMKPFIKTDTVFEPLEDLSVFKNKLTVLNDTVAWDLSGIRNPRDCIDLDPETIFNGIEVRDPLEK
jgi:nicotinic acid phosphoribosyltransferase